VAAEVDAVCNAGYGEVTPERLNSRNGYRARDFDIRVGTIELAIPSSATTATTRPGCSSRGGGPSGR
jgi:transposase-like protein